MNREIRDIITEQGWNDSSVLEILWEYVENQGDDAAVVEHFRMRQETENYEPPTYPEHEECRDCDALITIHQQGGTHCIWAEVTKDAPLEVRQFQLAGTGHPLPVGKYIGTFIMDRFVGHVYEDVPEKEGEGD